MKEYILVTGSAGFIGYHLASKLALRNCNVINIDNLNNYYDIKFKKERLKKLSQIFKNKKKKFIFKKIDLSKKKNFFNIFKKYRVKKIIHLAAQAGVRYSFKNPRVYAESNLIGFFNVLEACRLYNVKDLVFASSSSVYGESKIFPFKEKDIKNNPLQFYASTKLSNELMAYSYSKIYDIQVIGLRFFTVYGPWGRPDMAYFSFAKKITNNETIKIFNHGDHFRDFTYIEDIVKGILLTIFKKPKKKYQIFNLGFGKPIKLMNLVGYLEKNLKKKAKLKFLKKQKGDMYKTYASIKNFKNSYGYQPKVKLKDGIKKFSNWYLKFVNEKSN